MTLSPFDQASPLPPGWAYATVGDFRRQRSATFNPSAATDEQYELWSIPSHASGTPELVALSDIGSNKQRVSPGDVLISRINPRLNRTWVVQANQDIAQIASTEWVVFPNSQGLNSRFLATLLSDSRMRNFLAANASGIGGSLTRVRPQLFDEIRIPVPPLDEQRRIVERIEALFDEIDKGVESLRTARRMVDHYRQSLLRAAFEGRLTAEWRGREPDKVESPDALLARIHEEREKGYAVALEDWEREVVAWIEREETGRKPAKPKRPTDFAVGRIDAPGDDSGKRPSPWLTASLSSLGTVVGGLTKNQKRNALPLKAKYLRVANVYANRLKLDEIKEIGVTEEELRKSRLVAGDLLFVEGNGSIEQIGRVAIWDGSIPDMTHQNHLIRFSSSGLLSPRFALYFMMSPVGRGRITVQASSTSGLHTLSISKVGGLRIPICSPAEQAEVVRILDVRLETAEALNKDIDVCLARAEALRQSILKRAFSGDLVPQDPDDEPADALLARIRASRSGDSATKHRTRAPRPACATAPS